MRPLPERPRVRLLPATAWLAAIAIALVAVDLAERFAFYEIRPRDRRSIPHMVRRPIKDTGLALLHGAANRIDLAGLPEGIPVFDFTLKPQDADRLLAHLTRVRVIGTHDTLTRQAIPARMRVEGRVYDVRIKLRGRQHYHVIPPRPSLRVSLRHGQTYRRARDFNLVEPFDKTSDQVFLWEAQQHGLIDWDSTMGVLALDGRPLAVVQYVEQVRRETGDHAVRPEGTFFRGTGELYSDGADPKTTVPYEAMEEVLDLGRFRWFTALTELSGDGHGFANFNMKAHCDPVSPRVEFLIWDTRFGRWKDLPRSQFAEEGTQFLRDDRYRTLHDQALYVLATERIEPMLERMRAFHALYGTLLSRDPLYWFPRGGPDGGLMRDRPAKLERTLRANAAAIRDALEGDSLLFEVDVATRELRMATPDRGAKRVEALVLRRPGGSSEQPLAESLLVPGRYRDRQPVLALALPAGVEASAVAGLVAANAHTGRAARTERAGEPLAGERVLPPESPPAVIPPLPAGFAVDPAARRIRVGPGTVRFDGVLSLPRGFGVEVAPGTVLLAGPGALLEVHGDLGMRGTPAAPIELRGATPEPWGAFAVVGERGRRAQVEISHATVRGGIGSNVGSTGYTGSVAIYYADARLDHFSVQDNGGEDALNLKYSSVHATDNFFRGGASDAVDYDFVTGVDLRTRIEDFGNDGIDASGSTLRIEGARIRGARDKGISIGEASRPEIVDAVVSGARIGCAVKDHADARIQRLTVVRSQTALALYTKKPSYGPPRASFSALVAVDVEALAIVDHGAELRIAGSLRLGDGEPAMREFAGIENRLRPGLAALPLAEILSAAADLRSELGASYRGDLARAEHPGR